MMNQPRERRADELEVTHFALLMPSIKEGIRLHSEILSVTFCAPHVAQFARVDHYGASGSIDVPMTYSMSGPPHVEILQATGDGLWSPDRGLGVHHVGGFAVDFEATVARYDARGLQREATIYAGNGEPIIVFFTAPEPGGYRLEVLSPVLRPSWTEWVSGGPPPGHGPQAE
jgi:hypothetical protein